VDPGCIDASLSFASFGGAEFRKVALHEPLCRALRADPRAFGIDGQYKGLSVLSHHRTGEQVEKDREQPSVHGVARMTGR
jgi:hypothetical protein